MGLYAEQVLEVAFFAFNFSVFPQFYPQTSGLFRGRRNEWGTEKRGVRKGTARGWSSRQGGNCPLTVIRPVQAAHRGADPPSGVCATPAWRGCLPEPVHPCGYQWEEVCALSTGGVPTTLCPGWAILGRSLSLSRKTSCVTSTCWLIPLGSGHLQFLSAVKATFEVQIWEARVRGWVGFESRLSFKLCGLGPVLYYR